MNWQLQGFTWIHESWHLSPRRFLSFSIVGEFSKCAQQSAALRSIQRRRFPLGFAAAIIVSIEIDVIELLLWPGDSCFLWFLLKLKDEFQSTCVSETRMGIIGCKKNQVVNFWRLLIANTQQNSSIPPIISLPSDTHVDVGGGIIIRFDTSNGTLMNQNSTNT